MERPGRGFCRTSPRPILYDAGVAKLVYAADLGSAGGFRREGSIPSTRTMILHVQFGTGTNTRQICENYFYRKSSRPIPLGNRKNCLIFYLTQSLR